MIEPTLDASRLRSRESPDTDPTRLSRGDETPSHASSERDPLDHLAEEFAERCRRGENPSISEFEARFPERAEQVRRLLGAVATMEQLRRGSKQARYLPDRIGEFRILRELGRGGMGVVYEAVQESLWRHVAVKVIHQSQLDLKRLQRFQREAQAVAQLHHTNIVPIFGIGEHDGIPYYAMQYIRGRGLDALLGSWRRDGLLPSRERWRIAARYLVQTAEALGYAHEQGVLHRDVKPANLLIDEHDAVWVTDFGLAKMVGHDELTASGDVIGTLRYLAPESLRGHSEARSDVYSLGLTLYELLTLQAPFGELSPSELLHRVNEGRPVRPRAVDPSIPRDLETIVLKATAREPKDRYKTAQDLGRDLQLFLDDRPIRARQATAIERAWRWSRRNRGTAALIALTVGSIVLAAILGWTGYAIQAQALIREEANRRATNQTVDEYSQMVLEDLRESVPADSRTTDDDIPLTQTEMPPERIHHGRRPGGGPQGGPGFGPDFGPRGESSPLGPEGAEGPPPWAFDRGGSPVATRVEASPERTMAKLRRVLDAYDRFARRNQADPLVQSQAGWVYFAAGQLHQRLGEREQAEEAFLRSVGIFEALAHSYPTRAEYFRDFVPMCALCDPWQTGQAALEAISDRMERMEVVLQRLLVANPQNAGYLRAQMQLLAKIALVRSMRGRDRSEVDGCFAKALAIADGLVTQAPYEATPHTDRADVREAFGLIRNARGEPAEARRLFDAALADLDWVAYAGLLNLPLAMRMEALADDFEELLGDQRQADAIQVRADRIDPRPPISTQERRWGKAGRPFGRFRPEATATGSPGDSP